MIRLADFVYLACILLCFVIIVAAMDRAQHPAADLAARRAAYLAVLPVAPRAATADVVGEDAVDAVRLVNNARFI